MPRIRRGLSEDLVAPFPGLCKLLINELKDQHETGQPIIDEQHSPTTHAVRVTVIWDRWSGVPDEIRTAIILNAYETAEGKEFRDRIALAVGLTVPEATASGLLPFEVIPAVRENDPVTLEDCRNAMISEAASVLVDPNRPVLRFATIDAAEACVRRLGGKLPGSQPVWIISQEASNVGTSG